MNHYADKVAIITGGGSGIGRALSEALGQSNAIVFVADINAVAAERVATGITTQGRRAHMVELDVARSEAVEDLVSQAVGEYGRLDYMFNNAGIGLVGEIRDMELSDWQRILNINLWGVIHGTSSAYKVMVSQGFGHIVNTASGAGLCPAPMNVAYAATKYAVVGLSTSLRHEAAGLGIKVSVVCPGFIRTGITESTTYIGIERNTAVKQASAFRMMHPADCARIVLRGVARNQAIIPVTAEAHLAWRFYRMAPGLHDLLGCIVADKYRKSFRQD